MVGTLPPIKGISPYCFELVRELSKQGPIDFYSFKSIYPAFLYPGKPEEKTATVFSQPNLTVFCSLSWKNPFSWLKAGLESRGPLLHFQWWTFFLFPVFFSVALIAKLRKKKVVCTVHNVLGHETGLVDYALSKFLFLLPDHFIVHTEKNAEQLSGRFGIPPARIDVVPHGILSFYNDKKVSKAEARRRLSVPANAKVILFFGNVREYKGLDTLVSAFKSARKKIPGLFLLVAGMPWNKKESESLQRALDGTSQKKLAKTKTQKGRLTCQN